MEQLILTVLTFEGIYIIRLLGHFSCFFFLNERHNAGELPKPVTQPPRLSSSRSPLSSSPSPLSPTFVTVFYSGCPMYDVNVIEHRSLHTNLAQYLTKLSKPAQRDEFWRGHQSQGRHQKLLNTKQEWSLRTMAELCRQRVYNLYIDGAKQLHSNLFLNESRKKTIRILHTLHTHKFYTGAGAVYTIRDRFFPM